MNPLLNRARNHSSPKLLLRYLLVFSIVRHAFHSSPQVSAYFQLCQRILVKSNRRTVPGGTPTESDIRNVLSMGTLMGRLNRSKLGRRKRWFNGAHETLSCITLLHQNAGCMISRRHSYE